MAIKKRFRPAVFADSQNSAPDAQPGEPMREASSPDAAELDSMFEDKAPDAAPMEPPPGRAPLATMARPPARQSEAYVDVSEEPLHLPPAWPIYLTAFVVAALWAAGPIAFAIGYRSAIAPLTDNMFALGVFAMLAAGPAVFVFFAAYMIRQGQRLAAESRRTQAMAQDMLAPALAAAVRAGEVVQGVRDEIVRASNAADDARETLLALRQALAAESERLVESTDSSVRTTHELATTLSHERSQMGALAASLDAQAARVTDAISQQARMVSEATELAETQLREAEGALSARAADIVAAAGETSNVVRTAGEDLTRHIARLETAGAGVSEQVRAVEGGLSQQRAALVTLTQALRSDHDSFGQQAEAHAARLAEFIQGARLSSGELADRAVEGGESLRSLMSEAAEQFRILTEAARGERDAFSQSTSQSLQAVAETAAGEREKLEAQTRAAIEALAAAAEETRQAAARHAAAAREQVDQLSEAAFAAGQQANKVFEARLGEARALVAQASEMVDQAGAATAKRLEEGAAAARASLAELQVMMAEVEQRAARMPANAKNQADLVRQAFTDGLGELNAQARRTAEEAQAMDAAFQDRARRHFEMLGEAVRLMGASAAAPTPPLAPERPKAPEAAAKPSPAAKPAPPIELGPDLALEELMEPAPAREPAEPPEDPGLRPRLRLTPTATDAEFAAVFDAAGGPPAEPADGEGETWTWKDLLASIDGADAEGERLQDILGAEVRSLGVDSAKLLPKPRIDEIAAAVQTGDSAGAREVVRRLAGTASRRIARKLATDDALRRQAQVYVRRYQTLVEDAAVRDPEGFLMANLLADEAGQLYLLLDSAAGDQQ